MHFTLDFFGNHLIDRPKLVELRAMQINPEHRQREPDLMRSRWYDYRMWHPVIATYFFAHCYKQAAQEFYARYIDARKADRVTGLSEQDCFKGRDAASLWLARGTADRLGVPYPFYLSVVGKRAFERTERRFPRPNQIYGEEVSDDVAIAWAHHIKEQIVYGRHPDFLIKNWRGTPQQGQHIQFLLHQVRQRPAPQHGVLARLLVAGVIDESLIRSYFGDAILQRTLALSQHLQPASPLE